MKGKDLFYSSCKDTWFKITLKNTIGYIKIIDLNLENVNVLLFHDDYKVGSSKVKINHLTNIKKFAMIKVSYHSIMNHSVVIEDKELLNYLTTMEAKLRLVN